MSDQINQLLLWLTSLLRTQIYQMDHVARKYVFGVSDKVRLKLTCSATETSYNIEISPVASLNMILSHKKITAGWSAQVFSSRGPK